MDTEKLVNDLRTHTIVGEFAGNSELSEEMIGLRVQAAYTIEHQSATIKALTDALESALYWANMANGAYVIGQSARDNDLSAAYDVLQKSKEE